MGSNTRISTFAEQSAFYNLSPCSEDGSGDFSDASFTYLYVHQSAGRLGGSRGNNTSAFLLTNLQQIVGKSPHWDQKRTEVHGHQCGKYFPAFRCVSLNPFSVLFRTYTTCYRQRGIPINCRGVCSLIGEHILDWARGLALWRTVET